MYSDHWGTYDGLTFSSWEVNPPNITGYSPTMMVQCMNDPGPVVDNNPSSPTYGQLITDPLYNPAYSDFCYENPYMPGLTTYLDTPVVPTEGFVGAAYNSPDCSYPDSTPGIKEVDGDGIGPWVSKAGVTLTITSIGNTQATNSAYSGPSANTAPFNAKTVGRHYGFGTQCLTPTSGSTTCSTLSSVTIGGKQATIDSWSDAQIQVTVPTGVPNCAIQQQAQYGGSTAQCGELVVTAGNGRQSVDAVTVTIGGKTPTHVSASTTIQSAIDGAAPGDLLIVDPTCTTSGTSTTAACSVSALDAATPTQTAAPAVHNEMLLMWKPVRLQGVGAVSSILDATAFPAGKLLDPWRRHVNCLFGLTLNGVPVGTTAATGTSAVYDPSGTYSCPDAGWKYFVGATNAPQIDRLPLEAVVGWDATVNGNLAEQLQEPSLMGAYEGAGITVLGKGVWTSPGESPWTDGSEPGAFPPDALLLQDVPLNPDDEGEPLGPQYSYCFTTTATGSTTTELVPNPYPSNYECNPSSIDGITVRDSSQGGGGIFIHGWAHNLQVANNRVYNNAGTLSGGITVGQGEFPIALTVVDQEGTSGATAPVGEFVPDNPPSCLWIPIIGTHLPYCLDVNVNVHNNNITANSSLGDELFSGTLAGGGGATFCTGSDYYKFNYNWVCGNVSSAEGGGVAHIGFIYDGDIEHNTIALNQSTNPTIPTNGGGLIVMGTPDTDPICGTQIDADCPPGLSDGTGPGLVINANLIQANAAESGSGGGIRLQQVNGTEVSTFPTGCTVPGAGALTTCPASGGTPAYKSWNSVAVTNNMVVNNMAGWDGAGISLEDALNVSIINNTVSSNDSLATSGVLTQSVGTPQTSAPAGNCVQPGPTGPTSASCPQSAGVTSEQHSPVLATTFTGLTITCPPGMPNCTGFSNPLFENNLIWQNRSFYIGIGNLGQGNLNQQNLVSLFDAFTGAAAPVQTAYGQCNSGVSYWDIGVRGDSGPTNHGSGFTLNPTYSVLDDPADYPGASNLGVNPNIVGQYCNGSRVPPTCTVAEGCGGPSGYGVPPGIVDASSPNPVFSLTPAATVDEGNNWINVSWGPLALSDDSVAGGANANYGGGPPFANYVLAQGSPAIDYVPVSATTLPTATTPSLSTDFFGNPRPDPADPNHFDVGAVEFQGSGIATIASISPASGEQGTIVNVTITGTNLTGTTAINVTGAGIAVSNIAVVSDATVTATFTIAANATLGARNVTITTPAGTSNAGTFTVVAPPAPTLTSIVPASETRGTSVSVTLTGTNFVTGSTVAATPAVAGFTISNVAVVSPTSITATFTSTTATALGNVNIDVVTAGGATNTLPFAINGPVLTSITPASGNRRSAVPIILAGTGLTGTTAINVSGGGVTVTGLTVVSDSQVTATLNLSAGAAGGARNVTVTSPAGTSNAVTFTVIVPPGAVTSISPNTGAQGTSVPVIISGVGLTGSTGVTVSGGGFTVTAFSVVNDNTINATFEIAPTAALTARNVIVSTAGGPSNPVTFTVVSPGTPTLTSITPASGLRGNAVFVTLTGTGFTPAGTTVHVTAPAAGLTISGVTVVNATTITATFTTTTAATTTIGPRSIYVTTPGGNTGTVTYNVTGPVLTGISPVSGVLGTTVPVTLSGSGLTGTTAITVAGGGVTVNTITVVSDSTVTANFVIAATAAATARNVTVTAPGGVSNAVTFTVVNPGAPTLTSVAPATGVRGTTITGVLLTGTNFSGTMPPFTATSVGVSGAGVTVSGLTVTSATSATVTFTISATATLGAHNVTITSPGGTSNAVPFTVQGPTLTSISPTSGVRGSTITSVTLTGVNLAGATAITVSGGGITVSNFVADSSTSVTATFTIAPGAALGAHNIGVTTPIGTTNLLPFTVTGATVAISAPAPTLAPTTANTAIETGTITVSNAATATGTLTLTANPTVTKVGATGGSFAITGGTCLNAVAVAPGGSCTIIVQYTPPSSAATNTATATAHVTITGSGMATASMASANFTAN